MNVVNFNEYKQKFDLSVISVGDFVEWQDFTGEKYVAQVTQIKYLPLANHQFAENPERFPTWEKEDYSVMFDAGLTVYGNAIVRKVTPIEARTTCKPNLGAFRESHHGY